MSGGDNNDSKWCNMSRTLINRPDLDLIAVHGMVTVSPQMKALFKLVERVARTDSTVLIRGETGTGKELVAGMLHALSRRGVQKRPFKAINCATLTPELLASELFGHVRGAFTGAVRDRRGLFEQAEGGTVFLDEIGELPMDIQARLLRVLQERTFVPLGGTDPVEVDVRLLSATNRSLREAVEKREFREDLMYRVRVVPIFLPRLAVREGDIEALTWHFIDTFNAQGLREVSRIEPRVMDALSSYTWPGNIRELRNVIEYAFAVGEGALLSLDELVPELRGEPPPGVDPTNEHELERRRLLGALDEASGHKGKAADLLGISRSTLWRKLKEHRIADQGGPAS